MEKIFISYEQKMHVDCHYIFIIFSENFYILYIPHRSIIDKKIGQVVLAR